jgi:L-rhamnose isomerase/sugar isomerase
MRATIRPSWTQVNRFPATYETHRNESAFAISRRIRQTRAVEDAQVLERLAALEIETPSWGYGNSGTRFHVFPWPGAARNAPERIDDAALVHRLTGCCPSVALHIPWDRVDPHRRDQPEPLR